MRPLYEVITRTTGIRGGLAVFSGTRIPVARLIEHLDRGGSVAEFVRRHPQLAADQARAACALALEAFVETIPIEPAGEQASLLPRTNKAGVIVNAEELRAGQVVGRRVRCPACRTLVFRSWPEGWDSHAATKCRGLQGRERANRKAEFKRRYEPLFR